MRHLVPIAFTLPLMACAASDDALPPTLEIAAPERGTMSESSTVTVTGTVRDDSGWAEVHVNGALATIDEGGNFTATIDVIPGVAVIETIARDRTGNERRDVRAVMSGPVSPVTDTVTHAVGARIGAEAMGTIGDMVAGIVEGLDLTALAQQHNPVASDGGSCMGYDVYILEVDIGDVGLALAPTPGAIQVGASVTELDILGRADYRFSCFDGSKNFRITASLVAAEGGLGLAVSGNEVRSSVRDLGVVIHDLELETSGIPGAIVDMMEDEIEERLPGILADVLSEVIPPRVDAMLADLTSKTYTVPALGHSIGIQARPSAVAIDEQGALVALDGSAVVAGGEGGVFVSTPTPVTSAVLGDGGGLALAVADDTINQLFAGLWAAGATDLELPVERGNPLALLFGEDTRSIQMTMLLPPTASADGDGALRLVVGDMIVRTADESGAELATFALTMSTSLAAELPDGAVRLRVGQTRAWAHILSQSERIDPPLEESSLEALAESLSGTVDSQINAALESIRLPTIAGVGLVDPAITAGGGFVVVSTELAPLP